MALPSSIGSQPTGTGWRFTASLGLVASASAVVRVFLLDHVLRNDEVVTATRFAVDLATAVTDYSAPNNHILHSILVNLSTSVFGLDPWAIRLPAFVFGVGLIVAVDWWITSATGSQAAGLFAAAFVGGSSLLVEYSTVARGYTMVAVAFVILLELSRRLLHEPSFHLWIAWVLVSTAGLLTVPVFVFPLATVGTWFLLAALTRRRAIIGQLVLAALIVAVSAAIAYMPAAIATGVDAIIANPFVRSVPWSELPGQWYRLTANLAVLVWRDGIAALVYGALFTTAVVFNQRIFGLITPAVGLVGPLVVVLARQVAPPQRVWLFVWPLVLGMAGAAVAYLLERFLPRIVEKRIVVMGIAVSIAILMGIATLASGDVQESREGGAFHDAPEVARLLLDVVEDDDRVLADSHPRWVLDYYWSPERRSDPALRRDFENAQRVFIVVYHLRPQSLEGVMTASRFPTAEFSTPFVMWSLPETDIYVTERIGA